MALLAGRRDLSNEVIAPLNDSEIVALVTIRLQDRLPHVAPRRIEEEVVVVLGSYAGSTVRAFMPILVERQALARLRQRSTHDAA
jgi:hypothetical protein